MDMCGIALAKKRGVRILLHGGFSSNIPVAVQRGNFAIVTVLESVISMQKKFATQYGKGQCTGIYATGLAVHSLTQPNVVAILHEKIVAVIQKKRE
mmetsp:Transcript_10377/g.24038  ORF Transcript_10377/g.24038 Transcript_10377/m.24038 type:complete len:96 (-) Transcript_10377:691-978(-)